MLAGGQNPLEYAQAILRVCRLYLRSPLACASGVSGADLDRRITAIMARRELDDIDPARKLLLAGLLLATLAGAACHRRPELRAARAAGATPGDRAAGAGAA